jgi:hypothetical protein
MTVISYWYFTKQRQAGYNKSSETGNTTEKAK